MDEVVARNPELINVTDCTTVDDEPAGKNGYKERNIDRIGRATVRVMHWQQDTGVPIWRLAKIFGMGEEAICSSHILLFSFQSEHDLGLVCITASHWLRGGKNDNPKDNKWMMGADDRELATSKDETGAQADNESMVDEICDDSSSMVDELCNDNSASPMLPRLEKQAPWCLHITLSAQHPCLPNPTAKQLQEGFHAPVKNYGSVNMVDRLSCARLHVAFHHIQNLSALGRAYGLAHNPISSIVYNELWPPDNIADDHELVGLEFLHAFPATSSPQLIKRPTRRPSTNSKSTVHPAKARTSWRKLNSVTHQRRTCLPEDPSHEEDEEDSTNEQCLSCEIDDVSSTHALLHSKSEPGLSVIPAGTFALFVATQAAWNAVMNGGVTLSPDATASTGVPLSSAEVSQQASSAAASNGATASPVETEQQPSSTEQEVPAALSAFLQDVGLFDMSKWGTTLVKLGIKSMDEVRMVARLDNDWLLRTLERLLLPVNMSPLFVVSLAETFKEIRNRN
ncbi:hypothetical protein C8R43DRAFT_966145 [Mycena crocata]|nr:hypothetical protein C8R43DRAFT_966145 [Mycena crocata]